MVERSMILREKGTNRNQFFRGLVAKYSWVDLGSSYLPSDLLAAFLLAHWKRVKISSKSANMPGSTTETISIHGLMK